MVVCPVCSLFHSVLRSAQVSLNWLINEMHLAGVNSKLWCQLGKGRVFLNGNC